MSASSVKCQSKVSCYHSSPKTKYPTAIHPCHTLLIDKTCLGGWKMHRVYRSMLMGALRRALEAAITLKVKQRASIMKRWQGLIRSLRSERRVSNVHSVSQWHKSRCSKSSYCRSSPALEELLMMMLTWLCLRKVLPGMRLEPSPLLMHRTDRDRPTE